MMLLQIPALYNSVGRFLCLFNTLFQGHKYWPYSQFAINFIAFRK
jgi:hypothetical protein